jgi:hypothetical protein
LRAVGSDNNRSGGFLAREVDDCWIGALPIVASDSRTLLGIVSYVDLLRAGQAWNFIWKRRALAA